MKKLMVFFLVVASISIFAQNNTISDLLNVSRPSGVVSQPYFLRAVVMPGDTQTVYDIGLEAHAELFGLNFAIGTTSQYPGFELNQPVYVGAGITIGNLFGSLRSKVSSFEKLSEITSYETPTIAFGIAGYKKTSLLFPSWSRFELSYQTSDLLKKQGNSFVLNDSFDWTNASATLKIESCDIGYFMFTFNVPSIKEALDGNFIYNWELALPVSVVYIYFGQPDKNEWLVGLGAAATSFNALGTYNIQTGEIKWLVSAQM